MRDRSVVTGRLALDPTMRGVDATRDRCEGDGIGHRPPVVDTQAMDTRRPPHDVCGTPRRLLERPQQRAGYPRSRYAIVPLPASARHREAAGDQPPRTDPAPGSVPRAPPRDDLPTDRRPAPTDGDRSGGRRRPVAQPVRLPRASGFVRDQVAAPSRRPVRALPARRAAPTASRRAAARSGPAESAHLRQRAGQAARPRWSDVQHEAGANWARHRADRSPAGTHTSSVRKATSAARSRRRDGSCPPGHAPPPGQRDDARLVHRRSPQRIRHRRAGTGALPRRAPPARATAGRSTARVAGCNPRHVNALTRSPSGRLALRPSTDAGETFREPYA